MTRDTDTIKSGNIHNLRDRQTVLECVVVQLLSCVQLFVTPWTTARQTSLSFSVSQCVCVHVLTCMEIYIYVH